PAGFLVKNLGLGLFEARAPAIQAQPAPVQNPIELQTTGTVHVETFDHHTTSPRPPRRHAATIPWSRILYCAWIAAALFLAARLLVTFLLAARILNRASPLAARRIARALQLATNRLAVNEHVDIFTSPAVRSPMIWCWRRRPALLLPEDAAEPENTLDWTAVICHELAHYKRRDHVTGLCAELAASLLPWNPLIWQAKKRLVRLSEQACDDWVLEAGRPAPEYAQSLLDLLPQKQPAFVSTVVADRSRLAARIRRILHNRRSNPRTGLLWGLAVTIVAVSAALTAAFAQTRPPKPTVTENPTNEAELTTIPESADDPPQTSTDPSPAVEKTVLRGRVTGPDNQPIRDVTIQIRQRREPGQLSIAARDIATDEQGYYRYDQIAWPYGVGAIWRENLPGGGYRHQYKRLNKTLEASQTVDFRFDRFPAGASSLVGAAIEPNGRPLADFTIDIRRKVDFEDYSGDHLYQFGLRRPFSAAAGAFEIRDLPAGAYRLSIFPTKKEALELRDSVRIRSYEFVLTEGRTLKLAPRHALEKIYFGRVLFDDGRPAVPDLPALKTHIVKWTAGYPEGHTIAIVENDGYFTACISDDDIKDLRSAQSWLTTEVSKVSWSFKVRKDRFPVDLLSTRRRNAGSITIARPSTRYGRVLFEDGRPAVPDPLPWPGAEAFVILRYTEATSHDPGITERLSTIDTEGCFAAHLPVKLIERVNAGQVKLEIYFPSYLDRNSSYPIARFPARLLSPDKANAGALRIKRPEAMPAPAVSQPGSLILLKENDPNTRAETQIIRIDVILAGFADDARLDAQTIREIEDLLAGKVVPVNLPDSPSRLLRRLARATRIPPPENLQVIIDLLASREYLKILMSPTLEVLDAKTAKIISSQRVPIKNSAGRTAEELQTYRESITIKPHLSPDKKYISLEIEVDMRIPRTKASDPPEAPPLLHIDSTTTLDVPDGRYAALPICDGEQTKDTILAGDSLLLMVRPTVVAPSPPHQQDPNKLPERIDLKAARARDSNEPLVPALKKILAGYQAKYPLRPDGPNARPTHRVIVTLKAHTPAVRFFNHINGRHFTQQWCLLPGADEKLRLALDTTAAGPADLIQSLKALDIVADARPDDRSDHLNTVLGKCQWREAFNFAPYELLAAHITQGSTPEYVENLLGKPHEESQSPASWRYKFFCGPHAWTTFDIQFEARRVSKCNFAPHTGGIPQP
ncbi:MAG: hypothetical protein JSU94_03120, partial [Phycisphaerales bacterium]